MRTSTAASSERGLTLLELVVVLGVLALAAGLVAPRLGDGEARALEAAARRLADGLDHARGRAILGETPMRVLVDLDAGRWTLGRLVPGRPEPAPGPSPLERAAALPAGIRLDAVQAGGVVVRAGAAAIDLAPAGDPLPVRIDLAGAAGRRVSVVLPPAWARAVVRRPETP